MDTSTQLHDEHVDAYDDVVFDRLHRKISGNLYWIPENKVPFLLDYGFTYPSAKDMPRIASKLGVSESDIAGRRVVKTALIKQKDGTSRIGSKYLMRAVQYPVAAQRPIDE